jgi:hypothetical protein
MTAAGAGPGPFPLDLAGWSQRSIFGNDPDDGWWAQLWPDDTTDDEPDVWLGYAPPIGGPPQLARLIARCSGADEGDVDLAMIAGMGPVSSPAGGTTHRQGEDPG